MGWLADRIEELRFDPGRWLNDDDGEGPMTSAGVAVNARVAMSLTTVWRCVDLLASAVAGSPKDITIRVGRRSFPEYAKPAWLVAPRGAADPTYTIDDYFMQVAISLLTDGNYFTHVYPNVLDPQILTILPPHQVTPKRGPVYELRDATGKVAATYTPDQILHGTWLRFPGELRGISPLESLRRGIGAAIATEEFASRFFGQGAAMSFGVEVPGQLDKTQKEALAESLKKRYAGLQNSHAIGVLTGGAKFVPNLTATPEQTQMLASRKFSVEDLCRPYGVPPGMAGATTAGESYAASEVDDLQFKERAVLPLAQRIERQHNRLISVPPTITDPTATAQFRFNLDNVARVNLLMRAQAASQYVQAGVQTPNEAREKEDLPPLAGGDRLYMQSQMVPIDQLITSPNPAATAARMSPEG